MWTAAATSTGDGKRPKTIESYAGDVAGFLAHLRGFGAEFHGWMKRFHITGYRGHLLERGYEAATVNKKVNSLVSFDHYLITIGVMEEIVVDPIRDRVRMASGSERQMGVYTEGQLERLLFLIRGSRVSPKDNWYREPNILRVKIKVTKNKVAPPFKTAEVELYYGEGISREVGLIDLGDQCGILEKSGAWYSYCETRLGQGRENVRQFFRGNPEIAGRLRGR
ncbi:MAG: hypothetical protein ACYDEQ_06765 [Desulfocucumaceae bacterium]